MYPETDVPAVVITPQMLAGLKMPELFADRSKRFQQQYNLSAEQASVMAASPNYPLFEEIMKTGLSASIVVRALETIPIELAREGVAVSNLTEQHYRDCLAMVGKGSVAKEGLTDLLATLSAHPQMSASDAAASAGLAGVDEAEVVKAVQAIVRSKVDLVRSKGERAIAPLMGLVMKELRGKADGSIVSVILKKEIQNILKQ
jgi:glutamyl-tRNA(Gln) amidotransferase subunit E